MNVRYRNRALFPVVVAAVLTAGAALAGGEDSTAADQQTEKADLSEIRARAETMPIDARRQTDKRIGITVTRVNDEASTKGQATVATRLAAEFKMTKDALLDEKGELGWSWGDLVIAHTLVAHAGMKVTMRDLATLRSDGLGWGAIAFGLQFHIEDFEDQVKAEGRVAMGLSKAGKSPAEK